MRVKLLIVTLVVAVASSSAHAQQSYPASMVISGADVDVRSGPGDKFYPTMKLKAGDRVVVLREVKDNPGWLAIAPPSGSFSWIDGKYVKRVDNQQLGYVDADVNRKVPILPGSSLVNQEPNNVSHNLTAGCIVTIVHQPLTLGDTVWIPIKPHVQEERYIPAAAVRPTAQVVTNQNWTLSNSPTGNAAVLASVDQAVRAGNVDAARQILSKAASDTTDPATRTYYTNYLARLNQGPTNMPGYPNATPTNGSGRPAATTTAFSVPQAPQTPVLSQGKVGERQWSSYGTLQPSDLRIDGQSIYVLQYPTGQYLYITTPPGKSLSTFVGRNVALYGAIQYSGDHRKIYMQATDVSVP
jgi:uncharacterized protein YgiM (DUF1202 family)